MTYQFAFVFLSPEDLLERKYLAPAGNTKSCDIDYRYCNKEQMLEVIPASVPYLAMCFQQIPLQSANQEH